MPRKLTGNAYEKRGKFYARITLGPKRRPAILLPTCATQEEADTRAELLSGLAGKLRKAGQIEQAPDILNRAGEAAERKPLDAVIRLVDQLERGEWTRKTSSGTTLRQLGERWTSGELARLHPDHIREKGTATNDKGRLELYVYPEVANVAIEAFTLDDAERVMRSIPAERSPATRRHVAQLLHRLLGMAVFPLRLIPANPLPKGFLPKLGAGKAKGSIHPGEDVRRRGGGAHRPRGQQRDPLPRASRSRRDRPPRALQVEQGPAHDPRARRPWSVRQHGPGERSERAMGDGPHGAPFVDHAGGVPPRRSNRRGARPRRLDAPRPSHPRARPARGKRHRKRHHGERRYPPGSSPNPYFSWVPRDGIEPPTRGFSILCSTN